MRRAPILICILIAGCTGALRGGSLDVSTPHYWGQVDVVVRDKTDGFGLALARVSVQGGDQDLAPVATDAAGWATVQPSWPAKKSQRDAEGEYRLMTVWVVCVGYRLPTLQRPDSNGWRSLQIPVKVRPAQHTLVVVEMEKAP